MLVMIAIGAMLIAAWNGARERAPGQDMRLLLFAMLVYILVCSRRVTRSTASPARSSGSSAVRCSRRAGAGGSHAPDRMRILHLANHVDHVGNGIVNVAVDLAWYQAQRGHEVAFAPAAAPSSSCWAEGAWATTS